MTQMREQKYFDVFNNVSIFARQIELRAENVEVRLEIMTV